MNEEKYGLIENNVQVVINASVIDDNAREQVNTLSKHPAFHGLISIMPDVHLGKGSVIGFTGNFKNAVIPNVVGVDIGCGVVCYYIGKVSGIGGKLDFEKLDKEIRKKVPLGFNKHKGTGYSYDLTSELWNDVQKVCETANHWMKFMGIDKDSFLQIGTLGGGNHFIEFAEDENENLYLLIHSGSRNFGLQVCNYYQKLAIKHCEENLIEVPQYLEYLPLNKDGYSMGHNYLEYLNVAQQYASLNRKAMVQIILKILGLKYNEGNIVESVHNFIDPKDDIIRKGAIKAHEGDKVIIPFNMSEGSIIGIGKGISKYNFSAPHGAGRVHGRKDMQRRLASGEYTMEEFKERMNGIYSTCINEKTIDESPMAYKQYADIKKELEETVTVIHRLKPVYNLKA